MEGLIPVVYKVIKRTRTHSRYESLSSGTAQTYNVADFYASSSYGMPKTVVDINGDHNASGSGRGRFSNRHRRYNSVDDLSFSRDDCELNRDIRSKQQQQQLVRFRSHRMFSCITGAT